MFELLLKYIVSPWGAVIHSTYIEYIGAALILISLLSIAYLITSVDSKTKNDLLTSILVFVGSIICWLFMYGYLAMILCLLYTQYIKGFHYDRIKFYYVRSLHGYKGVWTRKSELDEIYDFDKETDDMVFNKEKMGDFYSSDAPLIYGNVIAIGVLLILISFLDGYCFLPLGEEALTTLY